MSDSILYTRQENDIAILQVNRPAASNALNWATQEAFATAVQQATDNPPRVLIVTGAGDRVFIGGGDLRQLSEHPEAEAGARLNRTMRDALDALTQLPCPVIGAVNGDAAGGGTEVLTACDLRLSVPTARFHFVQVRMGLTSGWGGTARLVRLLGQSRATGLMLTGQSLTAVDAHQIGFLHQLAPAGEAVLDTAVRWAEKLATLPRHALSAEKRLLQTALSESLHEGYQRETSEFLPLYGAPDNREAIAAFLEKRQPRFQ
ncbi:MAG: enoyl-CoA hydratase/isomerase family protein [Anaerolineales bacterium]|nr:enoyl-CoA hydratase/isomerase family protein [Anaerolineales bacterium]